MIACVALLLLLALISPKHALGDGCSVAQYATPGDFIAKHERFLTGYELSRTVGVSSATRCSVMCLTGPRCAAFTYWHLRGICVLHKAMDDVSPWTFSTNDSASFYKYKLSSVTTSDAVGMSTNAPAGNKTSSLSICAEYDVAPGDQEFTEEIFEVDSFTLDFSVKTNEGAVLLLSQQDADQSFDPVPLISIGIGVSGNNQSVIRTLSDQVTVANASTPAILSSQEFRQFWVSYQDGLVRFGRAAERQTALLEYDGRGEVSPDVRRVALMKGDWRILGDSCPTNSD